jgi:hypothetical protein
MADLLNVQILSEGFGSYLTGILPDEQATACGAFAYSISQIKNITNINIEDFAQVVFSLESTMNLPLTNGTDIPTDTTLADNAINDIALGSGPHGTYTISDFFGCLTGLPYAWEQVYAQIIQTQTPTLATIYNNLLGNISSSDSTVQGFIDQANNEIANIYNSNDVVTKQNVTLLNTNYDTAGQQLALEQRARYIGIPPVPSPGRDTTINPYPQTTIGFVDSLPTYAANTLPHMQAQTLEGIIDFCTTGGQSALAMLRAARNQARLNAIGIGIDDNISDNLEPSTTEQLVTNGTVKLAKSNAGINGYTLPAYPKNATCEGEEYTIKPSLIFDNASNVALVATGNVVSGNTQSILNGGNTVVVSTVVPTGPFINPYTLVGTDVVKAGLAGAVVGQIPSTTGSVANAQPVLPIQLNTAYTSSTLLASTPTVQEAIDTVILCNCDCWIT